MKKFRLGVLLGFLLLLFLLPATTAADSSVTVTVSAQGVASAGISNFTIIYVTDTELDFSWVLGGNTTAVMIRGKDGNYPNDITSTTETPSDGYLVYYGSGVSATDTSMNFDQNAGPRYYRAWAQLADGSWVVTPAEGSKESKELILLGFTIVALVFTGLTFWKEDLVFWLLNTIIWLVWAYWMFNTSIAINNTYINTALAILGAGVVMACIYKDFACILSILRRRRGPPPISYDEEKEQNRQRIYNMTRRRY